MTRHRASKSLPPESQGAWQQRVDPSLLADVRTSVLAEAGPLTQIRVANAVRNSGRLLGAAGSLAAMEQINAELSGLGPLQQLLTDQSITDIFVNGPASIWVDRGSGPVPVNVTFDSEDSVRALAVRLTSLGGRRLDDSSPCVDVKIDPGYRVHAVLPPISPTGTILSIRIRRQKVFTLREFRDAGGLHPEMERMLRGIVAARRSFLISGATGAGKTTLLSTLLGLCSETERLVLIEDAAELAPEHCHCLTLEARHSNAEGRGTVELAELVKQALRMNPSRLIVGECRGSEVRELLMALNTGHSGGGGTIHANSASDVPARLAALGVLSGMAPEATAVQAASALDVVIHVERLSGVRTVSELGVVSLNGQKLEVIPALTVRAQPDGELSACRERGWEALAKLISSEQGMEWP